MAALIEMTHLFGEIKNESVILSKVGLIAQIEWERLIHRFDHIDLDVFIVMPNHVHGIIVINEQEINNRRGTAGKMLAKDIHSKAVPNQNQPGEQFSKPVPGSIPTIIRSYKSNVTRKVRHFLKQLDRPIWQRSFYERVIRNTDEWERARQYILSNPLNWENDNENQ